MTQLWRAEAKQMAQTMNRYFIAHGVSAQVLAEDPTRHNRMKAELAASEDPRVRRDISVDPNDDHEALLRDWDEAIAQEPTDFSSHFYRIHYCVIAAVYYEHHFVAPATQKYGNKFFQGYQQFEVSMANLAQGHVNGNTLNGGTSVPPTPQSLRLPNLPPPERANINLESAMALLSGPEALLGMSFYQRDETIPGIWRVYAINRKTTGDGSYTSNLQDRTTPKSGMPPDAPLFVDAMFGTPLPCITTTTLSPYIRRRLVQALEDVMVLRWHSAEFWVISSSSSTGRTTFSAAGLVAQYLSATSASSRTYTSGTAAHTVQPHVHVA
ncbi:hypothetical protein B0H13DRAFT_2315503 [Mycena leptocephala]|nr:hypothetical protein B0H13DRAFT_2315503 [Mycena leptocephala]